ncbi:MAG: LAGLIDADG family homing endonuclease [Candidatus ainarchaeum sp.]|nr:LAGLIDADG family homing endonuclease [Candidatus ainarchaeum sp.]
MDLSELNRAKVKIRWKRIHDTEKKHIAKYARLTRDLKARVHGYLCGDGSVSQRPERNNGKMHYEIRFYPDHQSLIPPFVDAFYSVYGQKPHIKKLKNHYRVAITSTIAAKDLFKDGPFSSTEWRVPRWVMRSRLYSKEWIMAFFDAEAYIGRRRICVQCVNRNGLGQVREMLRKFGIESKEYVYKRKNPNWNINYHLVITTGRLAFLKRIGLNHKEKLRRLNADVA